MISWSAIPPWMLCSHAYAGCRTGHACTYNTSMIMLGLAQGETLESIVATQSMASMTLAPSNGIMMTFTLR